LRAKVEDMRSMGSDKGYGRLVTENGFVVVIDLHIDCLRNLDIGDEVTLKVYEQYTSTQEIS
jgi:hypothetical protein